jgi:hypothetical protein
MSIVSSHSVYFDDEENMAAMAYPSPVLRWRNCISPDGCRWDRYCWLHGHGCCICGGHVVHAWLGSVLLSYAVTAGDATHGSFLHGGGNLAGLIQAETSGAVSREAEPVWSCCVIHRSGVIHGVVIVVAIASCSHGGEVECSI